MAIIIFPTVKKDGSGDLSFMIKMANSLRQDGRIQPDIIFVSENAEQIRKNYTLDAQIKLVDADTFNKLTQEDKTIRPTLIIEGPTYYFGRGLFADSSVPKLYLTEYSTAKSEERFGTDIRSILMQAKKKVISAQAIESGFYQKSRYIKGEREYGIILDKELVEQFNKKSSDQGLTDNELQWGALSPKIKDEILKKNSPSSYHEKNSIYFQYSSKAVSTTHYLRQIIQLNTKESNDKHCELILVGKDNRQTCVDMINRSTIALQFIISTTPKYFLNLLKLSKVG